MVNLVHHVLLHAFPELLCYFQLHTHSVCGVGGAVQPVTSILVGISVSLGSDLCQVARSAWSSMCWTTPATIGCLVYPY